MIQISDRAIDRLSRSRATGTAWALFAALVRMSDGDGVATASQGRLAAAIGKPSRNTIARAIAELVELDLVENGGRGRFVICATNGAPLAKEGTKNGTNKTGANQHDKPTAETQPPKLEHAPQRNAPERAHPPRVRARDLVLDNDYSTRKRKQDPRDPVALAGPEIVLPTLVDLWSAIVVPVTTRSEVREESVGLHAQACIINAWQRHGEEKIAGGLRAYAGAERAWRAWGLEALFSKRKAGAYPIDRAIDGEFTSDWWRNPYDGQPQPKASEVLHAMRQSEFPESLGALGCELDVDATAAACAQYRKQIDLFAPWLGERIRREARIVADRVMRADVDPRQALELVRSRWREHKKHAGLIETWITEAMEGA